LLAQYTPRIETFLSDIAGIVSEESEERLLAVLNEQPESESRERVRAQIVDIFGATGELVDRYTTTRTRLEEALEDATVLVGFTAASTTDLGVTPFEEEYLNVGMHATLLRTLRSGSFLDELPQLTGLLVFLLSIVILVLVVELLSPRVATIFGLTIVLVQITGSWLAIRTTGMYVPLAASSILTFVAFALVTAITYIMSERDKREIRLAFEHYLAPSVINALLEDPNRLHVGGEERRLTAMFTDVANFSTAVDRLEPPSVVTLLGEYLSEMTAPILETNGTIDKYEGDAIVAFFGAPLEDAYHARHACRAALAMRRLEPVLNDRLVRAEMTPLPLRTRVGIHTGTMTVGNLGTPERLDYTIIGPEVNLASRLENVNKQYGTWTIISEETYREAGEGFLVRQMDRVRVVGIDRPVRLYELLGATSESTAAQREALELFSQGLALFEAREWDRARSLFETVLRIFPTDGPARLFVDRCELFARDGVRESWDGVISLTEK
ncbi:MAG: adenylate/guanylate cyclase domain-containing protein, partial [Spirochaetota bacterium]